MPDHPIRPVNRIARGTGPVTFLRDRAGREFLVQRAPCVCGDLGYWMLDTDVKGRLLFWFKCSSATRARTKVPKNAGPHGAAT